MAATGAATTSTLQELLTEARTHAPDVSDPWKAHLDSFVCPAEAFPADVLVADLDRFLQHLVEAGAVQAAACALQSMKRWAMKPSIVEAILRAEQLQAPTALQLGQHEESVGGLNDGYDDVSEEDFAYEEDEDQGAAWGGAEEAEGDDGALEEQLEEELRGFVKKATPFLQVLGKHEASGPALDELKVLFAQSSAALYTVTRSASAAGRLPTLERLLGPAGVASQGDASALPAQAGVLDAITAGHEPCIAFFLPPDMSSCRLDLASAAPKAYLAAASAGNTGLMRRLESTDSFIFPTVDKDGHDILLRQCIRGTAVAAGPVLASLHFLLADSRKAKAYHKGGDIAVARLLGALVDLGLAAHEFYSTMHDDDDGEDGAGVPDALKRQRQTAFLHALCTLLAVGVAQAASDPSMLLPLHVMELDNPAQGARAARLLPWILAAGCDTAALHPDLQEAVTELVKQQTKGAAPGDAAAANGAHHDAAPLQSLLGSVRGAVLEAVEQARRRAPSAVSKHQLATDDSWLWIKARLAPGVLSAAESSRLCDARTAAGATAAAAPSTAAATSAAAVREPAPGASTRPSTGSRGEVPTEQLLACVVNNAGSGHLVFGCTRRALTGTEKAAGCASKAALDFTVLNMHQVQAPATVTLEWTANTTHAPYNYISPSQPLTSTVEWGVETVVFTGYVSHPSRGLPCSDGKEWAYIWAMRAEESAVSQVQASADDDDSGSDEPTVKGGDR